jgi:hypothetical protein
MLRIYLVPEPDAGTGPSQHHPVMPAKHALLHAEILQLPRIAPADHVPQTRVQPVTSAGIRAYRVLRRRIHSPHTRCRANTCTLADHERLEPYYKRRHVINISCFSCVSWFIMPYKIPKTRKPCGSHHYKIPQTRKPCGSHRYKIPKTCKPCGSHRYKIPKTCKPCGSHHYKTSQTRKPCGFALYDVSKSFLCGLNHF